MQIFYMKICENIQCLPIVLVTCCVDLEKTKKKQLDILFIMANVVFVK